MVRRLVCTASQGKPALTEYCVCAWLLACISSTTMSPPPCQHKHHSINSHCVLTVPVSLHTSSLLIAFSPFPEGTALSCPHESTTSQRPGENRPTRLQQTFSLYVRTYVTSCTVHYHHHRAIIISALPLSVVSNHVKHILYMAIHSITCLTVCDNT